MTTLAASLPRPSLRAAGILATPTLALVIGLLAGDRSLLVLLGAIALLVAAACLVRPDLATLLVITVLYSNAAAVAVRDHGLPYIVGIAFPGPLILPLAYHLLIKRRQVVVSPAMPFLIVYLLALLIGGATSRDPGAALEQTVEFVVAGLLVFTVVTNVLRTESAIRQATWIVVLAGAAMSLIVVHQFVTSSFGSEYLGFGQVNFPGRGGTILSLQDGGTPRLSGPIGEVNRFGQVLVVLVPLAAMLAASASSLAWRAVALLAMVATVGGIATSGSRGAALGVAAVMLGFLVFRHLRARHLVVVAVLGVGVLTAFPAYGERLLDLQAVTRLSTAAGGTAQGDVGNLRSRATESLAAMLAFTDHPIFGVGPGLFPSYYQQYAREVSSPLIDTRVDLGDRQAHNLFADVLAETGVVGFLAFMGALLGTALALLRVRARYWAERRGLSLLATGYLLALLAYAVSGMFLHLSYERYFWILLTLAATVVTVGLRPSGPDVEPVATTSSVARLGGRSVRTDDRPG